MRVAMSARTRLVKPGSALGSKITRRQPGDIGHEHHGTSGVTADSEGDVEIMAAQDGRRIDEAGPELHKVARHADGAHAFQPRSADGFKSQTSLRNQTLLHATLGADKDYFTRGVALEPLAGHREGGKDVAAGAASRDQELQFMRSAAGFASLNRPAG